MKYNEIVLASKGRSNHPIVWKRGGHFSQSKGAGAGPNVGGGERSLLTKMATEALNEGEVPTRESGRR